MAMRVSLTLELSDETVGEPYQGGDLMGELRTPWVKSNIS